MTITPTDAELVQKAREAFNAAFTRLNSKYNDVRVQELRDKELVQAHERITALNERITALKSELDRWRGAGSEADGLRLLLATREAELAELRNRTNQTMLFACGCKVEQAGIDAEPHLTHCTTHGGSESKDKDQMLRVLERIELLLASLQGTRLQPAAYTSAAHDLPPTCTLDDF